MPAVSKKQQRFFGMVRATQKGEMKNPSSEVSDVASEISMKDAKKFAKTKHKGLPEKKKVEEAIKRDEYGDPIGGPKISKKQVKKNLASNAKDEKIVHSEGAAWTKKSGQNKEGGLNEKGRKSYERENPGSDLKAPSKEKGNKRRKSFCARMKGMKKKLTSAKTARDPDSRINKSLRAWNCSYEPQGKLVEDYEEKAKSRQKFVDFYKKAKDAKAKKEKAIQGATDVPNYPQDQVSEGAAWTKKAGKNKEGGLNEKGRKSYERENPGSDLKAPSKKKGNKRRASFCARMKGMKKKLTSAKTARDPDSRINKSLRAWNC